MLLRELLSWPPLIGASGAGVEFPTGEGGVLSGVYPASGRRVTFSCAFEGRDFRCHLSAGSAKDAEKITELLSLNSGKTMKAIGDLEVEIARTASL